MEEKKDEHAIQLEKRVKNFFKDSRSERDQTLRWFEGFEIKLLKTKDIHEMKIKVILYTEDGYEMIEHTVMAYTPPPPGKVTYEFKAIFIKDSSFVY